MNLAKNGSICIKYPYIFIVWQKTSEKMTFGFFSVIWHTQYLNSPLRSSKRDVFYLIKSKLADAIMWVPCWPLSYLSFSISNDKTVPPCEPGLKPWSSESGSSRLNPIIIVVWESLKPRKERIEENEEKICRKIDQISVEDKIIAIF